MADNPTEEDPKDTEVAAGAGEEQGNTSATILEPETPEFVELYTGHELNGTETENITLQWPTQLFVLAGAEGSGKTTLVTSIYEHLCQGPIGSLQFAGSRTLLRFEQECHQNRIVSGGTRPLTERTKLTDEPFYYHLALRNGDGNHRRQHFLLSALTGELYRWARNSTEECKKLSFLRRANVILVLIDGARLANLEHRTNAVADAAGILDSFLDAEMVPPGCRVEFVFSKLDCIHRAGDTALDCLAQTQERLETRFRTKLPELSFRQLAARPEPIPGSEKLSQGLAEAFESWALSKYAAPLDNRPAPPPVEIREFGKFGWRCLPPNRRREL